MFSTRIDGALARVRASMAPGEHVLIVCHGGVIGTALSGYLGLRGGRRFPLARVSNTSISEVVLGGGHESDVALRVFNDARHVAGIAPWPAFELKTGCLALVSDVAPDSAYGSFGAHYDTHHGLLEPAPENPGQHPEGRLREVMSALRSRHPEQRVSLSVPASLVRAWAASALWPERSYAAELELPRAGSLCHLGTFGDAPVLHDYGVSLD